MLYDLITEPEEYLVIYRLLAELARKSFDQMKFINLGPTADVARA